MSILISLVVIGLLSVILGLLNILLPAREQEVIIAYVAATVEEDASNEPKVTIQQRQLPTPPSASATVANVITTTAPTSVSIPDTNEMTSIESPDFGSSDDFGMGFGFDAQGEAQGIMTAFGRVSSGGMTGYLFDMKKNRKEEPVVNFNSALVHVRGENYQQRSFKDYYRAEVNLSFSYLVLDNTSADLGPKSFQAEDEIEPSRWFAVYEGVLSSDHDKEVRFLGRFDDTILVFLNEEVVFDGSWGGQYSKIYQECSSRGEQSSLPRVIGRTTCIGDYVQLNAGDELRIVVAEIPGGRMGGGLFIEEKGVENPGIKDDGKYRYIPFTTSAITSEDAQILEGKQMSIEVEQVPVFKVNN